jgi:hypothetical protein
LNRHLVGRPFEKGVSGNPSGRPKDSITALARQYTGDAIKTLVEICKDPQAPPAPRVAAATVLLDRGWGRAVQTTDITSNGDTVRYVIMAVPEAENTEDWLQQYAPPKLIQS